MSFAASLCDLVKPELDAIDALRRLLEISPAVRRWLAVPEPRGPMPDVRARDRAEVEQLVATVRAATRPGDVRRP